MVNIHNNMVSMGDYDNALQLVDENLLNDNALQLVDENLLHDEVNFLLNDFGNANILINQRITQISNDISNRISELNNVSLATIGNITQSSNLNTSNYILVVDTALLNTSNVISNRITNLPLTKCIDNTSYLSYGNVNVYDDKIIIGNATTLTKYPIQPCTNDNNTKQFTNCQVQNYPNYLAFNHNVLDSAGQHCGIDNYTNGTAKTTTNYSFSGYTGDYIMVNIGEKFILNKVNFYGRSGLLGRAPYLEYMEQMTSIYSTIKLLLLVGL